MSTPEQKLALVENGLKIAKFIQANRDITNPTYGRSAIAKPTTKERAKAWEDFTSGSDTNTGRHERGTESQTRTPEKESPTSSDSNGQRKGAVSSSKDDPEQSLSDGGDSSWDGKSSTQSNEEWESIHIKDNPHSTGRGSAQQTGGAKSKESITDNRKSYGGDGEEDGRRTDNDSDAITSGQQPNKSVKEATKEDLIQIMDENIPTPRRRLKSHDALREIKDMIPEPSNILKKTTEENTPSLLSMVKPILNHGVIQDVPQSQLMQGEQNADVEDALPHVPFAREKQAMEDSNGNSTNRRLTSLEGKIDTILENQNKILSKLNSLLEIKEEINGIKKTLTNQGLALSTLDGYMSELMIAVPKSGIDLETQNGEINTDLRMVIGRDNSRARREIIKPYTDQDKIEVGDDLFIPPEVDDRFITKEIDNSQNNAAHFIPTEDMTSVRIIKSIIRKETTNSLLIDQLYEILDNCFGQLPISEIYETIQELLFIDKNSSDFFEEDDDNL